MKVFLKIRTIPHLTNSLSGSAHLNGCYNGSESNYFLVAISTCVRERHQAWQEKLEKTQAS